MDLLGPRRAKYPTWLPVVLTINVFVIWRKGHYMISLPATDRPQFWNAYFVAHVLLNPTLTFGPLCRQYPSHSLCLANSHHLMGVSLHHGPGQQSRQGAPAHPAPTTLPHCLKTALPRDGKHLDCVSNPCLAHSGHSHNCGRKKGEREGNWIYLPFHDLEFYP